MLNFYSILTLFEIIGSRFRPGRHIWAYWGHEQGKLVRDEHDQDKHVSVNNDEYISGNNEDTILNFHYNPDNGRFAHHYKPHSQSLSKRRRDRNSFRIFFHFR